MKKLYILYLTNYTFFNFIMHINLLFILSCICNSHILYCEDDRTLWQQMNEPLPPDYFVKIYQKDGSSITYHPDGTITTKMAPVNIKIKEVCVPIEMNPKMTANIPMDPSSDPLSRDFEEFKKYYRDYAIKTRIEYFNHLKLLNSTQILCNVPVNATQKNMQDVLEYLNELEFDSILRKKSLYDNDFLRLEYQTSLRVCYGSMATVHEDYFYDLLQNMELFAKKTNDELTYHFLAYLISLEPSKNYDSFFMNNFDAAIYKKTLQELKSA